VRQWQWYSVFIYTITIPPPRINSTLPSREPASPSFRFWLEPPSQVLQELDSPRPSALPDSVALGLQGEPARERLSWELRNEEPGPCEPGPVRIGSNVPAKTLCAILRGGSRLCGIGRCSRLGGRLSRLICLFFGGGLKVPHSLGRMTQHLARPYQGSEQRNAQDGPYYQ